MALGVTFLRDIVELKRRGAIDHCRRVVEIGNQQIDRSVIERPELRELFCLFGRTAVPHIDLFGLSLWRALGLASHSIDIDGGSIYLDLNNGRVPWRYRRDFDFIVNTGTTEHVANQGNAFSAIHYLTRVNGVMYHQVPAFGNVEHGLLGYQPKFFTRLAKQNDYEIIYFRLEEHEHDEVPDFIHQLNSKFGAKPMSARVRRAVLRVALKKMKTARFSMPVDR